MSENTSLTSLRTCLLRVSDCRMLLPDLSALLSNEEAERAGRFHRVEDRERFVLGRGMLRRICARHLGVAPREVRLAYSASGKPALSSCATGNPAGLEFNVSHAFDCVLLVWSRDSPVGVDIESLDHRMVTSLQAVAERVFSPEERAVLASAGAEDARPVFFRLWSRKEAVLKAEGWGLGGPLQSFSVASKINGESVWCDIVASPASGREWSLADIPCPGRYAAALAALPGTTVTMVDWRELAQD